MNGPGARGAAERLANALRRGRDRVRRLVEQGSDAILATLRRVSASSPAHPADRRLASMFAEAATGIAVATIDGRFVDANAAYCRMVGYTREELRAIDVRTLTHAEDRAESERLVREAMTRDPSSFNWELRCVRKDGAVVDVRASMSIVRGKDDAPPQVVGIFEDLSERKAVAAQLRHSQSLLEIAGRMARVGGWSIDLPERRLVWSDVVAAIHDAPPGYTPSLNEGIDLFLPQYRDAIRSAVERCMVDGTPYDMEVEKFSVLGRRFWTRTMGEAERDAQGRIVRLQGAFQEISQRKIAEEAMRESEERFSGAFEHAPIGVALVSPEGRFLKVNRALCRLVGHSEAALLARDFQAITHPEDLEADLENVRKMLAAEIATYQMEKRFIHERGHFVSVSLNVSLVRDAQDRPRYFISQFQDITARKQSEQMIAKALHRLNEAQRIGQIGDWEWDAATGLTTGSPQVFAIVGKDPLAAQPPGDAQNAAIFEAAGGALIQDIVARTLESGEAQDYELVVRRPDGERVHVHAVAVPRKDESGRWLGLHGTLQDITERRRDQDALRAINAQLEGRVLARTAELNLARDEAEQASRAKSAFLAVMSHEIRTPMNGVLGMLDVLQQTTLTGEQAEMMDLIRDSALSLLGIIADILDFSKIEAGKLEIAHELMDLDRVVEQVCGMLDHLAVKQGVCMTVFVDPEIPGTVFGDEGRLRQVLVNLCGNALKFSAGRSQPGRVSTRVLLVERDAQAVTVDLVVADNGIGMDSATLAQLFTPFLQADASTTRRFGGTGLGLAISDTLVRLMGGRISVRSAPDEGSTFTVRLRLATDPAAPAGDDEGPPLIHALRCRIVGREWPLADDFATWLAHAGAIVERSPDVAAAAAAAAHAPGLSLWLILPGQAVPEPATLRAMAPQGPDARVCFVVFGQGRRRRPRLEAPDLVTIDVNALSRRTLSKTLGLASGRMRPDASHELRRAPAPDARLPPRRPEAPRGGPSILVAEDNETNRAVIRRQLQLAGYAAVLCVNGREALESWRRGDFALVLTDLHMPEMDGYALASTIRAEEGPSGRRTPIIALTANALRDEELRCLAVGMDAYLTKPVRLPQLKAAIETWMKPRAGSLVAPP